MVAALLQAIPLGGQLGNFALDLGDLRPQLRQALLGFFGNGRIDRPGGRLDDCDFAMEVHQRRLPPIVDGALGLRDGAGQRVPVGDHSAKTGNYGFVDNHHYPRGPPTAAPVAREPPPAGACW